MIEKLLKAGADANADGDGRRDGADDGRTHTGNVEAAKVLLDHGAHGRCSRRNWHGETALMWATAEKHPAMVKELIAHGADVNARSNLKNWERQTTAEPREKWLPLGA